MTPAQPFTRTVLFDQGVGNSQQATPALVIVVKKFQCVARPLFGRKRRPSTSTSSSFPFANVVAGPGASEGWCTTVTHSTGSISMVRH